MSLKVFFCYAHEDEVYLNKLKSHFRPLQRQGLITMWHDRDIDAGTEWEKEISQSLNDAEIILLLVSPDFMNSDYCYSKELQIALDRHERREALVIPVIIRHVHWRETPISKLQALPTDAKPIKSWLDIDEAFYNVVEGIRKAINKLPSPISLQFDPPKQAYNKNTNSQNEDRSKKMMNVLFLATNPTDTTRLRLDKEHRTIVERLRLAQADRSIRTDLRGAVRPSDLQAYLLQFRPNVVHFSGHGDKDGRILLENEIGEHQAVPIEALTNLFRILKDNVQIILINACWSKAQAESLATHIDYVIGMSRAISDESAIRFAEGFYQALGYGSTVRQAFDLGKNNLELHNRADNNVPQMLVRPGVDEARPIFVPD